MPVNSFDDSAVELIVTAAIQADDIALELIQASGVSLDVKNSRGLSAAFTLGAKAEIPALDFLWGKIVNQIDVVDGLTLMQNPLADFYRDKLPKEKRRREESEAELKRNSKRRVIKPTAQPSSEALLLSAAKQGDLDLVNDLRAIGIKLNAADAKLAAPDLLQAIRTKQYHILLALIMAGVNIQCMPFLHLAININSIEIVQILLDAGVNKEALHHSMTPLNYAISINKTDIVQTLIHAGVNKETSYQGRTPLHSAIRCKNIDMVKALMEAGVNKETSYKDMTPLHYAINQGVNDIVKILVDKGANIETAYKDKSPLHFAIHCKNADMVKTLIDAGAHIETLYNDMTPLQYAIKQGANDIVEILINKGADKEAAYKKQSPLFHAMFLKKYDIIKTLIKEGANINASYANHSFLFFNICRKNMDIIQLIVDAHPEYRDVSLWHCAILLDNKNRIQTLINEGEDIEALDFNRRTPLHLAILYNKVEIAQMLIDAGANIETSYHIQSPLHFAIALHHYEMAHLLIKNGATKETAFKILKGIEDPTLIEALLPYCVIKGFTLQSLLLDPNTFNSDELRCEFLESASPLEFFKSREILSPVTLAALELLKMDSKVKKHEEALMSEEEDEEESAMSDSFVARANWHFENKVQPYFRNQFMAATIDPLTEIENRIRALLLKNILEQAEAANEQPTIAFIQENKDKLIQANPTAMQASCAIFTQASSAQAAWRGYNPFAPVTGEWPNLLTTPTDNAAIYTTSVAYEGELLAETASQLLRERVAYYYLAVIDANDGDDATRATRIENFISQLADIRNAHGQDDPSCYPGSITRCANMGAFHYIAQLPPTTKEMIINYIRAKVLATFQTEIEKLATFAEKEKLYQSLVELTTLQAKEMILYPERYLAAWLPIRQRFSATIGTAEDIFAQIVEKNLVPILEEDKIFIEQALLDVAGGTINVALADHFNRHTDSVPTEAERQNANPFMQDDATNYPLADILLKSIFQDIPVYAASIRKLRNLSEYLAHKIPALSKGAPLKDLLTGLEIAEQDFNKVLQAVTSALERSGWQAPMLIVNPFDAQAQQMELLIKNTPPHNAVPYRRQLKSLQTKQQYFNDYLPSVQQAFQDCSLNNDNLTSITEALAMHLAIADGRFDPTEFCNFLEETERSFVQQHPKLLEHLTNNWVKSSLSIMQAY